MLIQIFLKDGSQPLYLHCKKQNFSVKRWQVIFVQNLGQLEDIFLNKIAYEVDFFGATQAAALHN